MFLKSLIFSLFLVSFNVLGQEFVSVCDRSNLIQEFFMKNLQILHHFNGSCEASNSVLNFTTKMTLSGGSEDMDSLKVGDFSNLPKLIDLKIEFYEDFII